MALSAPGPRSSQPISKMWPWQLAYQKSGYPFCRLPTPASHWSHRCKLQSTLRVTLLPTNCSQLADVDYTWARYRPLLPTIIKPSAAPRRRQHHLGHVAATIQWDPLYLSSLSHTLTDRFVTLQVAYQSNTVNASAEADQLAMEIASRTSPVLAPMRLMGPVVVQQVSRLPVAAGSRWEAPELGLELSHAYVYISMHPQESGRCAATAEVTLQQVCSILPA